MNSRDLVWNFIPFNSTQNHINTLLSICIQFICQKITRTWSCITFSSTHQKIKCEHLYNMSRVLWLIKKEEAFPSQSEMIYSFYYTPVWKTDVLCYGNVRPSVRPSIPPSVRPSFPDFFSTCFEISISNLVNAFSRWHDMSSLSFITIGSLWPSLQPNVGQTQFLQSLPYKSR